MAGLAEDCEDLSGKDSGTCLVGEAEGAALNRAMFESELLREASFVACSVDPGRTA